MPNTEIINLAFAFTFALPFHFAFAPSAHPSSVSKSSPIVVRTSLGRSLPSGGSCTNIRASLSAKINLSQLGCDNVPCSGVPFTCVGSPKAPLRPIPHLLRKAKATVMLLQERVTIQRYSLTSNPKPPEISFARHARVNHSVGVIPRFHYRVGLRLINNCSCLSHFMSHA
jgi:hypothetical protein